MNVPNFSDTFKLFWKHPTVSALGKQPQKCKLFRFFYLLKKPSVATLNETYALTSRTNVAKKGMIIPTLSETLRFPYPESKKKECDRRDLNISDQFETLIPCSTIYFLGIRARLLQKTNHRKFFCRYKKLYGLKFLRVEF